MNKCNIYQKGSFNNSVQELKLIHYTLFLLFLMVMARDAPILSNVLVTVKVNRYREPTAKIWKLCNNLENFNF